MRDAYFAGATTCFLLLKKSFQKKNRTKSRAMADALFKELDDFVLNQMLDKIVVTQGNA